MKHQSVGKNGNAIHIFFDCYSLPQAITYLDDWLHAACTENSQWKNGCAAGLLWFHDHLLGLIRSMQHVKQLPQYSLQKQHRETALDPKHYTGKHRYHTAWEYFPRHLSLPEFIHPHKAINKCMAHASYSSWKLLFRELLHTALSNETIYSCVEDINIRETEFLLKKFIEAAHIIQVRMQKEN